MTDTPPTAKQALIEAAIRHSAAENVSSQYKLERIATRLAVFGLIELLEKDDPMRDLIRAYFKYETSSLPVFLDEDKLDKMTEARSDFSASAEAVAEQMFEGENEVKRLLGIPL